MFNFILKKQSKSAEHPLLKSSLHNEKTFYQTFLQDLEDCQDEVIIESPFITSERMRTFDRIFEKLLKKGVNIYVITRDPKEHDVEYASQAEKEIRGFEIKGVQTFLCSGNHHRKLAIIDKKILWEGSLNILSQARSRELMRRIDSLELSKQMLNFLKLDQVL